MGVTDRNGDRHAGRGAGGGRYQGRAPTRPDGALADTTRGGEAPPGIMSRYGLTPGDLPGIDQAWTARFGVLDGPEHMGETAADAAAAVLGLDDEWHVSSVRPQPDGSVHVDADDGEDDRERTFVVGAGPTADRLTVAAARDTRRRTLSTLAAERNDYLNGRTPPWRLLASPDQASAAARTEHDAARRNPWAWTVLDDNLRTHSLFTAVMAGGPVPDGTDPRTTVLQGVGGGEHLYDRNVALRQVADTAAEYHQATRRAADLAGAMRQAETLPDGPLRRFLLADRPERTYRTTEGTGRNKRHVTRTYRPKSELADAHKHAAADLKRATGRWETLSARLTAHGADLQRTRRERDAAHAARAAALDRAWAAGWPGDPADMPTRPARTPDD